MFLMPEDFSVDSDSAAFNFAIDYLKRIDLLISFLNEASRREDAPQRFKFLEILYRELRNEIYSSKTEPHLMVFDKPLDLELLKLKTKYHVYMKAWNNHMKSLHDFPDFQQKFFIPPNDFVERLHDFELRLRQVIKDKGMQMPSKSDAKYATY